MSRNNPSTFAANTHANLKHIRDARLAGNTRVHEVTQIANSMLGLIVFPFEKGFVLSAVKDLNLSDLAAEGWPVWSFEPGSETETLGCLIYHLRNAAAHGKMKFRGADPDSPEPREILIKVEDWKPDATAAYLKASIIAQDLHLFCERLSVLLDDAHSASQGSQHANCQTKDVKSSK